MSIKKDHVIGLFLVLTGASLASGPCAPELNSVSEMNKAATKELEITSFDGIQLSGTLIIPETPELKAIFIPVHGSFVQTRDGDLDGQARWMFPQGVPQRKLFLDMAENLKEIGVGSFRFDKRASGKSGGVYQNTDLITLSKDLVVILKELRKLYPNIPIGFVGQSEGALTVLKSWDLGSRPDFIVLQGPALDPYSRTLEFQRTRAAAPFLNDKTGELSKKYPYIAAFYQAMYSGDMLKKIFESDDQTYLLQYGDWKATTSLEKYRQYMWNGFDLLKKVQVPTIVILGSKDSNVRPTAGDDIREGKAHGLYENVQVEVLENLEHSFREYAEGDNFISVMNKPISPRYFRVIRLFFERLNKKI